MGAPKAPAPIYQPPTADEKQAAANAKLEKEQALATINQDTFARSQGYRGAASVYDWAGPTPFLAGDPKNFQFPGQPKPPATGGGGIYKPPGNGLVNPPGTGGAPKNTGAVPPAYPEPGVGTGPPRETPGSGVVAAKPIPGIGGTAQDPATIQALGNVGGAPRNTGAVSINTRPPVNAKTLSIFGITAKPQAPTPAPGSAISASLATARTTLGLPATPKPTPAPVPAYQQPGGTTALQNARTQLGLPAVPTQPRVAAPSATPYPTAPAAAKPAAPALVVPKPAAPAPVAAPKPAAPAPKPPAPPPPPPPPPPAPKLSTPAKLQVPASLPAIVNAAKKPSIYTPATGGAPRNR